ncbi:MAG TPA: aminotransferase class III-fold pyridoxal phosphate-dependent enzyme, partial [bacterium]|nr:aminotransferase class III-fold pyridoxal phosphate-dependent enzyme [bacterium]
RELCQKHGALLIYDEVQSGMGRTGKLFGYEHSGVAPDIMSLAKSLGAGLPIGACLASDEVAQAFEPGSHASTFGGNFLVCEAAKAFLHTLLEGGVLQNAVSSGAYFVERLKELQKKHSVIREVRGQGLMIGVDLEIPSRPLVEAALAEGLILNAPQEKVLRFVPPLIISKKEIDEAIDILDDVFAAAGGNSA